MLKPGENRIDLPVTVQAPGELDGRIPPLIDLTGAPLAWVEAMTDDVDAAAVTAASGLSGCAALWRTWRVASAASAQRVYLIETRAAGESLAGHTDVIQTALLAAGLAHAQVELFRDDMELPAYQRMARGSASLLWTSEPFPAVAIARVFDGAEPTTGPYFDPDRPLAADDEEWERIAPLMPIATYSSGAMILPVWPTCSSLGT